MDKAFDKGDVKQATPNDWPLKENKVSQRKLDLFRANGEEFSNILKYDLPDNNMLFHGDIMAKAEKSKLVKLIEFLPKDDDVVNAFELKNTYVVIGFMPAVRSTQNMVISIYSSRF